jgi:hypothetical protein
MVERENYCVVSSAISFINIRNNKGANTDPWGTSALSSQTLEIASLIITL